MKVYKRRSELKRNNLAAFELIVDVCALEIEELEDDDESSDLFQAVCGGDFHVVESVLDLQNVKGLGNGFTDMSLSEGVPIFDSAAKDKFGNYFFCLCTNNAGGDGHFVPKEIAEQCTNVEAAFKLRMQG